jgi:2-polyprenyl-3-methyl-5-hydroxy-6-metoxy-1,4-benzoquinol methylase
MDYDADSGEAQPMVTHTVSSITDLFADFADHYDSTVLGEYQYQGHSVVPGFIFEHLAAEQSDRLRTRFQQQEPLVVLDLGCGSGLSSKPFFDYNKQKEQKLFQVTGVDVTEEMLVVARKYPYERVICHNLEESPLPAAEDQKTTQLYDIITMLGVLEFVNDPYKLLTSIAGMLQPSGVLGVTIPAKSIMYETLCSTRTYEVQPLIEHLESLGCELVSRQDITGYVVGQHNVAYAAILFRLKPVEQ